MKIPSSGIKFLLGVMFLMAIWVRSDSRGLYPYFKGESATNFRHAIQIAANGQLPQHEEKSAWPDGYKPALVKSNGVEYLTGYAFRLFRLFSDESDRKFVRWFTTFVFSLTVLAMYGFASTLWGCQTAGLFAALLFAVSGPLIRMTNGTEFHHTPFATLAIIVQLLAFVRYRAQASGLNTLLVAASTFALLAIWEPAPIYLGFFCGIAFFTSGIEPLERRRLLVAMLSATVAAGLLIPDLRAQRLIVSWPSILILTTTLYLFLRNSLPRKLPGAVYIIGGFALVVFVFKPLQAGGVHTLYAADEWLNKTRLMAGRPADPQALPDAMRFLWSIDRSSPAAYRLFEFFFPFLFLLPAAIANLPRLRRETSAPVWLGVALGVWGTVVFLLDRSTLPVALIGVASLAAAGFYAVRQSVWRAIPIAVGVAIVLFQSLFPLERATGAHQAARLLKIPVQDKNEFLWVSLGNADQELVRFISTRTSVHDVFLGPPDISALLVQFSGRTMTLVPGVLTTENMRRTIDLTSRYYGSEEDLFAACDTLGAKYVIYSIDYFLDTSVFSPRYMAGRGEVDRTSVAFKMHFAPERLTHFTLVYENDIYRLFRVSDEREIVFLTDHPPVYQPEIGDRYNDSLESFYARVVDILATFHTAVAAQARGNEQEAIRRFRYCLEQAPKFTKAWLGVGDSAHRLNDLAAANAAYKRVLEYAPDNAHALYYAALTHGQIGEPAAAIGYLDVLIASSRDRATIQRAQELRTLLQSSASDGEPSE